MASLEEKALFLQLIRFGIGAESGENVSGHTNWSSIHALANQQGLNSIVLDGLDQMRKIREPGEAELPDKKLLKQWIGEVYLSESLNNQQHHVAEEMALLFHTNGIRTYVLKGAVVAECYPKPEHRTSSDFDCFLLPENGNFDAWSLGNDLIASKNHTVIKDFYKNSTFHLPGLTVENHRFLTPFRGNKRLKSLEIKLQSMLKEHLRNNRNLEASRFEGTWLYRPPVMVTALFLIEHAYSHFLHEGLTWRQVLDWMLFRQKHESELNWPTFESYIDEFGFRRFIDSYQRLGRYLLGEIDESTLSQPDKLMLQDIWNDLDLHDTKRGLKGKIALAGNTWRARWKYRLFTDMTWVKALWIQGKGVLFDKEPRLS